MAQQPTPPSKSTPEPHTDNHTDNTGHKRDEIPIKDRRSSLQKQARSKELNDGFSLTKNLWINDSLSDVKNKTRAEF
jgi:hypothetical protein